MREGEWWSVGGWDIWKEMGNGGWCILEIGEGF